MHNTSYSLTLTVHSPTKSNKGKWRKCAKSDYVIEAGLIWERNRCPGSDTQVACHGCTVHLVREAPGSKPRRGTPIFGPLAFQGDSLETKKGAWELGLKWQITNYHCHDCSCNLGLSYVNVTRRCMVPQLFMISIKNITVIINKAKLPTSSLLTHVPPQSLASRVQICLSVSHTDIERRSQKNPILLRVMASSAMGLKLGVFGSLPTTHTRKQTQTKCVHNYCTPCGVLRMFIFTLGPQYIRTRWIMNILIVGKTWIGAPCRNEDGAGSGISCLYLWYRRAKCSTF